MDLSNGKVNLDGQEKEVRGIFNIEGVQGKSKIKIIPQGKMELRQSESIPDKLIAEQVLMKGIAVTAYACNILDQHLMRSKTQPILYVDVVMQRKIRSVSLCRIYLYFTITSIVRSGKELLNRELAGNYELKMLINGDDTVLEEIDSFPGTIEIVEKMVNFIKSDDMMEIINDLIKDYNDEQKKVYDKEFGHYSIPENRISLRNYSENSTN